MAVLDGNDLRPIKELVEVKVEVVIEQKELVTKADLNLFDKF